MREKCLKRILTHLGYTKCNEINISHLHIQKHISYKKIDAKSTNIMCTGSHKSFPMHCILRGGKFLKRILTYLYSTKYNEINVCHLDVQNHTSYKIWYK